MTGLSLRWCGGEPLLEGLAVFIRGECKVFTPGIMSGEEIDVVQIHAEGGREQ